MGAVTQAVLQGVDDQIALHVRHGAADQGTDPGLPRAAAGALGRSGGMRLRSQLAAGQYDGVAADAVALGQQDGPVDGVLQLAHVAAPVVRLQQGHGVVVDGRDRHAVGVGVLAHEVLAQDLDVARPLAQRRQVHVDDVEAEIEVLAELAGADLFFQVAVRGRQHADIDLDRLGAADAVDLALLDGAQQLGLEARIHLGDFIEQQGAAAGLLELADAARHGAGEGALFMTEELGLQEVVGDGGAVDRDEGALGALGLAVDVAGHDLLAGAGFAGDQDAGLGGGDLFGEAQDRGHARVAGQVRGGLLGDGGEHRGDQRGVGRQRDVLLGAGADRLDRQGGVGADAAGHHRDRDALVFQGLDQGADLDAHVNHEQIRALAGTQRAERAGNVIDMRDLGAALERDLAGACDVSVQ